MDVRAKLNSIALKNKCRDYLVALFEQFGKAISDLEDFGPLAVLMDSSGKYLSSNLALKGADVARLEKWGMNRHSCRLAQDFFAVNLSEHIFYFNPYQVAKSTNIILVGSLLEFRDDFRFINTVLESRELTNFRVIAAV